MRLSAWARPGPVDPAPARSLRPHPDSDASQSYCAASGPPCPSQHSRPQQASQHGHALGSLSARLLPASPLAWGRGDGGRERGGGGGQTSAASLTAGFSLLLSSAVCTQRLSADSNRLPARRTLDRAEWPCSDTQRRVRACRFVAGVSRCRRSRSLWRESGACGGCSKRDTAPNHLSLYLFTHSPWWRTWPHQRESPPDRTGSVGPGPPSRRLQRAAAPTGHEHADALVTAAHALQASPRPGRLRQGRARQRKPARRPDTAEAGPDMHRSPH